MSVGGDGVSGAAANTTIPIDQQHQSQSSSNSGHSSSQSHTNVLQSKMSEILKRKAPPKRKSQPSSRSKSRNQDHATEQASSVMQELMNKASALGSSGRSTPSTSTTPINVGASGSASSSASSSSRSRLGSHSKASSFLASLNPGKYRHFI